ncbi:MAG: hypothetical protein IT371_30330 [Deltaproteobacteria bacterium]|nr:hypothetical protein [Deltaproteobacteria bacterium]
MAQAGRDADALGLVAERVRGQSFMGSRVARETDNGLDKALISGGSDAQRLFGDSVEGVTSFVRDLEAAAKKARQAGSCPMSAVRAGLCLTVGLRGLRQVLADTAEVASPFFAGPYAHRVELASQMQALRDVFSALAGGQDRLVVMARAVLDGRGPE